VIRYRKYTGVRENDFTAGAQVPLARRFAAAPDLLAARDFLTVRAHPRR
jgi:hypothetical protein